MSGKTYVTKRAYLNRHTDADLVAFLENQVNVSETIKLALRAYVNGAGDNQPSTAQIDPQVVTEAMEKIARSTHQMARETIEETLADVRAVIEAATGDIRATVEAALVTAMAGVQMPAGEEDDFEADFSIDLLAD